MRAKHATLAATIDENHEDESEPLKKPSLKRHKPSGYQTPDKSTPVLDMDETMIEPVTIDALAFRRALRDGCSFVTSDGVLTAIPGGAAAWKTVAAATILKKDKQVASRIPGLHFLGSGSFNVVCRVDGRQLPGSLTGEVAVRHTRQDEESVGDGYVAFDLAAS